MRALSVLALAGCSLEEEPLGAPAGTGSGAPAATSGDTMPEEPDARSFLPPLDAGAGASWRCDLWTQDCPAKQKCTPWADDGGSAWNATRCSPIAARAAGPGEPCEVLGNRVSGIDDCELSSMCWGVDPETNTGHCVPLCAGDSRDPICENPNSHCVQSGNGALNLCLPMCDPLAQDCPGGQACYLLSYDAFLCAPDASETDGGVGDACEFLNVCDPGLVCVGRDKQSCPPGAGGCCRPICEVGRLGPPCSPLEECEPWAWFSGGTPPRGLEDVGYCHLLDL